MAVAAGDLKWLLSGASGNSDPNASLGGGESASEVVFSPTMNNLFDNVDPAEASSGATEYRCIYLQNDHATDTIIGVKVWINSQTPSSSSSIEIGLDPVGKNGTATGPISPSSSAPAGVSFSAPSSQGSGLAVGTLNAQDTYAVWIKRVISALAPAAANDPFTLSVSGTPS